MKIILGFPEMTMNFILTAAAIFRKLAKKKTTNRSFHMSGYEITRSLAAGKGMQSKSYLVVVKFITQKFSIFVL